MFAEWSPAALRGLRRRERFLRVKNPRAAKEAAIAIVEAGNRLTDFPNSGRPYARSPERLREQLVPFGNEGYLLLYLVLPDRVRILAIKHMREFGY